MINLVKSELYRLINRKSSWIILFLSISISIAYTLMFIPGAKYGDEALKKCLISAINYQSTKGPILRNSNALNNPHAVLSNINLFLFFIVLPTLICSMISEERSNGSIRMVLTRSYFKGEVFLSKLIAIILFNFITVTLIFITSSICGKKMLPAINYTNILLQSSKIDSMGSFLFNIKFYCIFFIQMTMISVIFSIVATFVKNTVVAIMLNIALLISGCYLSKFLANFIVCPVTYIYDILGEKTSCLIIAIMLFITAILVIFLKRVWDRLDFVD